MGNIQKEAGEVYSALIKVLELPKEVEETLVRYLTNVEMEKETLENVPQIGLHSIYFEHLYNNGLSEFMRLDHFGRFLDCLCALEDKEIVLTKLFEIDDNICLWMKPVEVVQMVLKELMAQKNYRVWDDKLVEKWIYRLDCSESVYKMPWEPRERILIATVFSNREDMKGRFDYIGDIKEAIRVLDEANGSGDLILRINAFNPLVDVADSHLAKDLLNVCHNKLTLYILARGMINKDEWLDKLCTIILANSYLVTGGEMDRLDEVYLTYNAQLQQFIEKMPLQQTAILMYQKEGIGNLFKRADPDGAYLKYELKTYYGFSSYEKFLNGNCDISEVACSKLAGNEASLDRLLRSYKKLVGDTETYKRAMVIRVLAYPNIPTAPQTELLTAYGVTKEQLMTLFNHMQERLWHVKIREEMLEDCEGKRSKWLEGWSQLFANNEAVLEMIMAGYQDYSLEIRYLVLKIASSARECYKSFLKEIEEECERLLEATR